MTFRRCALAGAIALASMTGVAHAQTVLFDFETDAQGWGSFGAITTDSGPQPFGSVGQGRYHAADFSVSDTGNFGIVDVSPPGLDLSAFGGLSVDAALVDPAGFEPFQGVRELDFIVATGEEATEEEFFAPKITMTQEYQTFAVPFTSFVSTLTGLTPTAADLADIRIKLVVLNTNGTGHGRLDYDQVTGLAPIPADADFDNDNDVDGRDFLIWQRGFGTGSTLAQGDANENGSVNAEDLAIWRAQFGGIGGSSIAASAIPEPTGVLLFLLGAASLIGCKRGMGG
jgi:hypothetical protein